MSTTNLFASLPECLDEEVFETLLKNDKLKIERIVSRGHASPETGWYDQQRHEWVAVLQGAALIAFDDGSEVSMKVGDFIAIPAHRKHRVAWTDPETETVWLAIHY